MGERRVCANTKSYEVGYLEVMKQFRVWELADVPIDQKKGLILLSVTIWCRCVMPRRVQWLNEDGSE